MNGFHRKGQDLYCEDVSLAHLADVFGTPLYVYSLGFLQEQYEAFDSAFAGIPHEVCFAMKANSSLAILNELALMGCGADIVSGGELYRALAASMDPKKIVYSGVGKTSQEMSEAIDAGILMFNIESFSELIALDAVAGRLGKKAGISLRVNPDVDPQTHPYIATGLATSKFGIKYDAVIEGYERAGRLPNIDVVGVDCHIGSQLSSLAPFVEAATKLTDMLTLLREKGFDIKYLDLGGGLGITYDDEDPPTAAAYGLTLTDLMKDKGITLILEPGRSLVGNAGVLLSRVLYTKKGTDKRFVIVDAGMNDLLRPSLYDAFHRIEEVKQNQREPEIVDVVGPICESGDFLARGRKMNALVAGDLLATMSAGAYGFSMASNYNSRPAAAEVLVQGKKYAQIRTRQTYEDLVRGERPAVF
ncbi:MAG: diaminopimelate decarboxylase [Myxococcota bacterium]|nr:diaminopimelate decarboxylase [Myxococcota bacterium]